MCSWAAAQNNDVQKRFRRGNQTKLKMAQRLWQVDKSFIFMTQNTLTELIFYFVKGLFAYTSSFSQFFPRFKFVKFQKLFKLKSLTLEAWKAFWFELFAFVDEAFANSWKPCKLLSVNRLTVNRRGAHNFIFVLLKL